MRPMQPARIFQFPVAPQAVRTPKWVMLKGAGSDHSMITSPDPDPDLTIILPALHCTRNFLCSPTSTTPAVSTTTFITTTAN